MPSYADEIARGRIKLRARLVIEGWPYIFVTSRDLVRTLVDGRQQIVGLDPASIRIAARCDLANAQLHEQEMSLEIVDVAPANLATRALHTVPTRTTWLTATVSETATTIPVADTAAFPSAGGIHIGTEAIAYTGTTSTSFTGCSRGAWNTIAQGHYVGSGDATWYPPVTDLPRALTDRRVFLWLYGSGDSSSGDGTLRWRGIARTDVSYERGRYTIGIDPVSRRLEQQVGGDLEEAVPIRGIYIPSSAALTARIMRWATDTLTDVDPVEEFVVRVSGFFASTDVLVDEINTQLAAGTAGWGWGAGAELRAESRGGDGYRFVYRTDSATAHYVGIGGDELIYSPRPSPALPPQYGLSPTDLFVVSSHPRPHGRWNGAPLAYTMTMLPGTVYDLPIEAPTPRATNRVVSGALDWGAFRDGAGDTFPLGRLYLGGTLVPTEDALAIVRTTGEEGDGDRWTPVRDADVTDRWIDVGRGSSTLGPESRIKMLRVLARGSVMDLISALVTGSAAIANSGAAPLITADELSVDPGEADAAIASLRLGADRVFVVTEGASLGEILEEELKLIGCYLALDSTGTMIVKRLGLVTTTETIAQALDASSIKGGFPASTRNPDGLLAAVLIKQGYDPIEAKHRGLAIRVRNTTSPVPSGGVLTIAPRSRQGGAVYRPGDPVEVDPEEAYLLASTVIGTFGEPYETTTLMTGLERFDLELGTTVLLTTPLLPGPGGTMGVEARPAKLIGYDWSPAEGRGTLELHSHDRRIAGYAPALPIASEVDNGGDEWTLTLTTLGYTNSNVDDWWAAGDAVVLTELDTETPTVLAGTVVSATATTLTVQFAGTWSPGAEEWTIGSAAAGTVTTSPPAGRRWSQTAFCFDAGSDRRVGFSTGDVDAFVFAP